jgi:hypothetical protein
LNWTNSSIAGTWPFERNSTMKKLIISLMFLNTSYSHADFEFRTNGLQDLVDALTPKIQTMKRPIYFYSWSQGRYSPQVGRSDDPTGYTFLQSKVDGYWNTRNVGNSVNGQTYGSGLYAAVDPVGTRQYGGGADWVVSQIVMPTGARVINFGDENFNSIQVTPAMASAFDRLGCPASWKQEQSLRPDLVLRSDSSASSGCTAAIKDVMLNGLKLDGFLYGYPNGVRYFNACNPSFTQVGGNQLHYTDSGNDQFPARNSAIVITSMKNLPAAQVRVFNSQTRDALDDRLRIQGLYYMAAHDGDFSRTGRVSPADLRLPFDATMTASHPPNTGNDSDEPTFFWRDLEGKHVPQDLWNWTKTNLLGCSSDSALSSADPRSSDRSTSTTRASVGRP